jgi:ATP-dependent RNA helicase DeaD
MTSKLFSELGLSEELLKAIDKLGFEQAAPIQAEAIPLLMQGRDIVGQSQTGSGKTAAFGIPAVEKADPDKRAVQVLILCPTRELAIQVSEEIHKLAFFKRGINTLPVYGGQSYERQFYGLKQGAQIVIGTPGRIMDHMRRGTLRLDSLKMVILDEVDVMLNMGFREDMELILQATPKERQTVFFSATIPKPIQQLIERYVRNPQQVRIEQKAMTVPTVEQVYYEVDRRFKIELLTRLIDIHDIKLGIIFCNTKRMVDDLVDHLEAAGYMADRLHGDMTQNMRDRVMNKFRKSGLEFLVATDVAARGIDVDDVEVVVNYDLPYDGEDYVHRIGRTGRAGRSGRAISFASGREVFQIRNIERYTNTRIQRGKVPTEAEVHEARENVFLGKIRAKLQSGDFKGQERVIERLMEEGFSSTDIAAACLTQLQAGEAAPARANQTEEYERPERHERGGYRDDRRGGRFEDRRGSRYDDRERHDRPQYERPQRMERRPMDAQRPRPITPVAPLKTAPKTVTPPPVKPVAKSEPAPAPKAVEKTESPVAPKPVVEKTYSDEEVLKELKTPEQTEKKSLEPKAGLKPKVSRAVPSGQTRLWMNLGETMDIKPIDIVNAIAGETGLPGKVVGKVDVREKHLFVDVSTDHANGIIAKLNRAQIKGHKVKVKVA